MEGQEAVDRLLGDLFAVLGGLGAVFGVVQCLLVGLPQGLHSGVDHRGGGSCLVAFCSGSPRLAAFGGELFFQPGDVRAEFLADPAGLSAGGFGVLVGFVPGGLSAFKTTTGGPQVASGLVEVGGAIGQRVVQGGDLPVVLIGRSGGLAAFGLQDALQGVALRGDAPGGALGGRAAFLGRGGGLHRAGAFGFVFAGRAPGRAFGLLGALLCRGGLLDGLVGSGDRGLGFVLGGGGALTWRRSAPR
ncbi:hypothetical protein ACLQ2R_36675 [Streptosporangium sp. DT93]|uniref:hypothetical protein n=1 Tax=Streptosporangium sp. DT93 TaxID=3393428 RepID=UPI003CF9B680